MHALNKLATCNEANINMGILLSFKQATCLDTIASYNIVSYDVIIGACCYLSGDFSFKANEVRRLGGTIFAIGVGRANRVEV